MEEELICGYTARERASLSPEMRKRIHAQHARENDPRSLVKIATMKRYAAKAVGVAYSSESEEFINSLIVLGRFSDDQARDRFEAIQQELSWDFECYKAGDDFDPVKGYAADRVEAARAVVQRHDAEQRNRRYENVAPLERARMKRTDPERWRKLHDDWSDRGNPPPTAA